VVECPVSRMTENRARLMGCADMGAMMKMMGGG